MCAGIYLLAITPRFTKIGRSNDLDYRLDYWRSHGIQVGLKMETTIPESHLLEWAVLRANEKPSDRQITAFMRREPMFPCNRLARPQGCSEWIASDMVRTRQQISILYPLVKNVAEGLSPEDTQGYRAAKRYLGEIIPRADGRS